MSSDLNRRDFLKLGAAGAGVAVSRLGLPNKTKAQDRPIRIGFVGVGDRGSYHLDCALGIEGVEIPAICDIKKSYLYRAKRWIEEEGRPTPRLYGKTRTDFVRMMETEDLDLVICSTSWEWHAPVLVSAMKNGKNAVSEVPIVIKIDEAWEIVETHESTGKWATLGFKSYNSSFRDVIKQGLLGEILHCESGYVHDLRLVKFDPEREPWRLQHSIDRNGNLYPDHPTCRIIPLMDINHGDRFNYICSMSSSAAMLNRYADLNYGPDHPYAKMKMAQGDYNASLIHTANGSMVTLNFDTNTPHPREFFRIQGTKGVYLSDRGLGSNIYLDGISPKPHQWEDAGPVLKKYRSSAGRRTQRQTPQREIRGHGGGRIPGSWFSLVETIREGRVTDFDVYDSVTSSVIGPLSEESVKNKSAPVQFPDFTRGKWKTNL